MRITAITRYKHAEIYGILRRLGWNQSDLARKCNLRPDQIGMIINLRKRPTIEQANTIQKAFGEAGEFLDVLSTWPETFQGLPRGFKREQTAEVDVISLEECPSAYQIPDSTGEDGDTYKEERTLLAEAMEEINPRSKFALELWDAGYSWGQIGKKMRLTREAGRQAVLSGRKALYRKIEAKKAKEEHEDEIEKAVMERAMKAVRELGRKQRLWEELKEIHFKP